MAGLPCIPRPAQRIVYRFTQTLSDAWRLPKWRRACQTMFRTIRRHEDVIMKNCCSIMEESKNFIKNFVVHALFRSTVSTPHMINSILFLRLSN